MSAFAEIYTNLFRLFDAPEVDEVLVNGTSGLWVWAAGEALGRPSPFGTNEAAVGWLQEWARRLNVRLDPVCASAGGSLADCNYRWHCLLPPLAQDGPLFSIRRHRFSLLTLNHFAGHAMLKRRLTIAVSERANILIAGPTSSGKTTLLSGLLQEYAARERVVLIEALAELPAPSSCSVRMLERQANLEGVGAVGLTRLVHEALRLRPDRLVVGEIRGHEAVAYIEALLSGHQGVMTTIHAASPEDALARIAFLANAGGWSQPSGWRGVPLTVVALERGPVPCLKDVVTVDFAPTHG